MNPCVRVPVTLQLHITTQPPSSVASQLGRFGGGRASETDLDKRHTHPFASTYPLHPVSRLDLDIRLKVYLFPGVYLFFCIYERIS